MREHSPIAAVSRVGAARVRPGRRRRRAGTALLGLAASLGVAPLAAANPVLRDAAIDAVFSTPTTCEVRAAFTITGGAAGASAEHRLYLGDGGSVEPLELPRAASPEAPASGGQLQVVRVPFSGGRDSYTLRYRVTQPGTHAYRCPVWLPTVATDGRSREVRVSVTLPQNASPGGGSFPSLDWRSGGGSAILGHVPSFLHVRYTTSDAAAAAEWDITRVMDSIALTLIGVGMVAFAWRRKRR